MIRLEQVEKVYRGPKGEVRALDGVSLDIAQGEFVAVRGPSGCGKSTLLNLVGGLARPTSGRVWVAGADLGAMSAGARTAFRARRVGFVFQTFHLLPYLTVLENVQMAASRGRSPDRARDFLAQFGLAERAGHRPAELSAGECQRAAIARALMNDPELLLADEPTGNLDPENAAGVLDLLADFHRKGGTVLLVTHHEAASQYSQRTVFLKNGRLDSPCESGNLAKGG